VKKMGRPATGVGIPITVRLPKQWIADLDAWRQKQDNPPSRPEAIRQLLRRPPVMTWVEGE
jgi:hypothetical protein